MNCVQKSNFRNKRCFNDRTNVKGKGMKTSVNTNGQILDLTSETINFVIDQLVESGSFTKNTPRKDIQDLITNCVYWSTIYQLNSLLSTESDMSAIPAQKTCNKNSKEFQDFIASTNSTKAISFSNRMMLAMFNLLVQSKSLDLKTFGEVLINIFENFEEISEHTDLGASPTQINEIITAVQNFDSAREQYLNVEKEEFKGSDVSWEDIRKEAEEIEDFNKKLTEFIDDTKDDTEKDTEKDTEEDTK